MSQKVQIYRNQNEKSSAFGKYFVRPVYDDSFIETDQLASFIQEQCTVKRSDIKAVLDELGGAMKHFFEMGQKIKLANIGVFKVGIDSSGSETLEGCSAANVKSCHVLFLPETEQVKDGRTVPVQRAAIVNGQAVIVTRHQPVYNHVPVMLKGVSFELAKGAHGSGIDNTPNP